MKVAFVIVLIWVAAILQQALPPHLAILSFRPDFLLVTTVCLSLCMSRPAATGVGFAAGLLSGAIIGANMTHYIISRCFAGFVGAWSRRLRFTMNPAVVGLTTAAVFVLAQTLFMFLAAPKNIVGFLGDTIGSAMYNGVLAIPLYALIKRFLNPTVR